MISVVLLVCSIGVPAWTVATRRGARPSSVAIRAAEIRTTHTMCGLLGLFNYLSV